MKKIITVTIAIVLTLTFNFHEGFPSLGINSTIINSISGINGTIVVASGTGSRSNTISTWYSPSPGNNVKDNKHMTSYNNTGTVLVY
ncbi:hypothetical protein BC351_40105 [Paenibacillus ferrarius]|uniref:Uncharacterized protein n=1 Tax=Paenibacillus ferrarius TaxID=1469647 RepID=A0A1V4H8D1_9BACL|nr:hypothetical protein [Paenibacillus ferrarius]OPH47385.1 hypothetical protein BC351_40105 [Paenibacillus ferrarius]